MKILDKVRVDLWKGSV